MRADEIREALRFITLKEPSYPGRRESLGSAALLNIPVQLTSSWLFKGWDVKYAEPAPCEGSGCGTAQTDAMQ